MYKECIDLRRNTASASEATSPVFFMIEGRCLEGEHDLEREMPGVQEKSFSTLGPKLSENKAQQYYGDKTLQTRIEVID